VLSSGSGKRPSSSGTGGSQKKLSLAWRGVGCGAQRNRPERTLDSKTRKKGKKKKPPRKKRAVTSLVHKSKKIRFGHKKLRVDAILLKPRA